MRIYWLFIIYYLFYFFVVCVRGGNLISSLLIFVQILQTIMTRVADDKLDIANGATKQKKAGAIGEIVHPVERGMITDWDAMEDLWHYVFYTGLNWEAGNEGQLLITEPLLTPKLARERMVQTMFETFNVGGLYAVEQAVLSLYAVGRITGVAVDIGHGKIGPLSTVCV
jgi:actin-related protein 7